MKPGFAFCAFACELPAATAAGARTCGNGLREGAEPCDDGNRASFDGCSARCLFEQVQRA